MKPTIFPHVGNILAGALPGNMSTCCQYLGEPSNIQYQYLGGKNNYCTQLNRKRSKMAKMRSVTHTDGSHDTAFAEIFESFGKDALVPINLL